MLRSSLRPGLKLTLPAQTLACQAPDGAMQETVVHPGLACSAAQMLAVDPGGLHDSWKGCPGD